MADKVITLKVRTIQPQRIRQGYVFVREWRRVDVSPAVAEKLDSDPELAVTVLAASDEEIPAATHVGAPSNLQDPPKAKPNKSRLLEELAKLDAEKKAPPSKTTEPASPPEGGKGGGQRGDARNT